MALNRCGSGVLTLLAAMLASAVLAGCNTDPTPMEAIEHERNLMNYGFKVVKVLDGATFVVDLSDIGDAASFRHVKLAGVDAPAYEEFKEPGGKDAFEFLNERILGKYVVLKFDTAFYGKLDARPQDAKIPAGAYMDPDSGVIYAWVYSDGVFLNRLIIQNGLARASRGYQFSRPSLRDDLFAREEEARAGRRGLWR